MKLPLEFEWNTYRYFPYERRLARREIRALLNVEPEDNGAGLRAETAVISEEALSRLTYFRQINLNGTARLVPLQTRLEASRHRLDQLSVVGDAPRLTRQGTRYSAHGIHEYRGKFNPQIVRAVANLVALRRGAWALDPFCGSGTCLLECAHLGINAVGMDVNPLAIVIANTKLEAIRLPPETLEGEAAKLTDRVSRIRLEYDRAFTRAALSRLRPGGSVKLANREYLKRWFAPSVLVQLEWLESEIERVRDRVVRNLANVVLSDCLRAVSWQDPGDLRVRRRKGPKDNYPAIPVFLRAFGQRVGAIARARGVLGDIEGEQMGLLRDARLGVPPHILSRIGGGFHAVITSPPYATALPYVDTQRLSLAFLGLLDARDIRRLERELIGNREIGKRDREEEERRIGANNEELPDGVTRLCRRALRLSKESGNGFRRRNVAALLWRYFTSMKITFETTKPMVRPGGRFALVVGPNSSRLGGRLLRIDTPELLATVAETAGWKVEEVFELDAYQRFDLHRRNSIRSEALVVLSRTG